MAEVPEGLDPQQKEDIDRMSVGAMHDVWKFADAGTFQSGDPFTEYFRAVMLEKRAADPAGWTQASKDSMR